MPIGTKLPPNAPMINLTKPSSAVPTRDLHVPDYMVELTGRVRSVQFQSTWTYNSGAGITTLGTYDLWVPNPLTRIRIRRLYAIPGNSTAGQVTAIVFQLFENDAPTGFVSQIAVANAASALLQPTMFDFGTGYVTRAPGTKLRINTTTTVTGGTGLIFTAMGSEELDVSPIQG